MTVNKLSAGMYKRVIFDGVYFMSLMLFDFLISEWIWIMLETPIKDREKIA